jgi:hypothetical protein
LKVLSIIAAVLVGAALIYGTLDMPKWITSATAWNIQKRPMW